MKIVESNRVLYTASRFAKESLIYLQEAGTSKTLKLHTSSRDNLDSYLFFIVLKGNGVLHYDDIDYELTANDCVFIDCNKGYSHTSDNWTITWIHLNGYSLNSIYEKYLSRLNNINYKTVKNDEYLDIINSVIEIANGNSYIRDMEIYSKLTSLLSLIMKETVYDDSKRLHKYSIEAIKDYLDSNYIKNISLTEISNIFYINKFYLTRLFKQTYGLTINSYILQKRISKAKELLRFTDKTIEQIAYECGLNDQNYFARQFKMIEGVSPRDYRKMW